MSRIGTTLLLLGLLTPAVAGAQRPGKNLWINTAELELARAMKSTRDDEQKQLFNRALENAMQATVKDGDNSRSWFVLGRVHAAMGNAAAADSAFDRAEAMWPEYVKETEDERFRAFARASNQGLAAIQANDLATAATILEGAVMIYDKRPTALLNLGSVYARLNEREKAAATYRRALAVLQGPERKGLKPEEEKQWAEWEEATSLNLAQLLAFAEKYDEAAQAYEDYLKRHPDNALIRTNLAVVYSRLGKPEEAARVYRELLDRDLPAEEYLRVGLGLRRAQQLDQAVVAFQKSIGKNPHQQEAYYNLAYAIWEGVQKLDEARTKAKPADVPAMEAQLRPMYEQLIAAAVKAQELDPTNRNMFALLQRGYRGLADLTKDKKASDAYKLKIPPLITGYDALPFEVTAIEVENVDNKVTISGKVVNLKTTRGEPMKFRLAVVDVTGKEIAAQDISVPAPDVEAEADFKAEFNAPGYAGWKYTVTK